MSLFLGKIHYWLYNKILLAEALEKEIIDNAEDEEGAIHGLAEQAISKFGAPTMGDPLENIIDTSNIHGWLQSKIESAESRQAFFITELLKKSPEYKKDIMKIYERQGATVATNYGTTVDNPEQIFNLLNDYILEGMPCDRVNKIVESNNNEFIWETTECLHKSYWDRVNGDVQNFYDFREAWVKAFVSNINNDFEYTRYKDGSNKIVRIG
jgi:hypothetical protein